MTALQPNQTDASTRKSRSTHGCARILEIGPYPPPYSGWSTRICVLKTGLEQAGHVCVPLNLGENRRIPSSEYECVRGSFEYLRKLMRYARSGYVFHIHTNGDSLKGFLLNLVAYGVSLLALRRPVLSFHAGTDQTYFPRVKSRWMIPFFKFLFGVAKAVICNDLEVARRIIDYGVPSKKVFPISAFSRQYLELPLRVLDRDVECFLNSHTTVVLTYLECRPEYAMDTVIRAIGELARTMPGLGLIVVGASRERDTIGTLLRAARMDDRSLHLGALDHATFLSLLRRVSVYLRSAKTEGCSASIREALYFGVPVVANAAASHPEGVVVYPWNDPVAMLRTLDTVLRDQSSARTRVPTPDLPDTVSEEVALLVRCT